MNKSIINSSNEHQIYSKYILNSNKFNQKYYNKNWICLLSNIQINQMTVLR